MFNTKVQFLLLAITASFGFAQDNHDSCAYWAESGECAANPAYMLNNCKTSCARVEFLKTNAADEAAIPESFYGITEVDITGKVVDFSQFQGKVVYIVNVASYCGYTESNYQLINTLTSKYSEKGLEVVLFPCNQFGAQEPGGGSEIFKFAQAKGFNGKIMAKADVNGDKTRPTFKFLKSRTAKDYITWNFDGKFIVDKAGNPHYIDSNDVEAEVQKYLLEKDL